ncbi:MAG: glycosyltransferase family 87 protein [Anaerolineae bacterium]
MKIKSFDVLLFFVLVTARVRIDSLADRLVAPRRVELIQRIPVVGSLLPQESLGLLHHWMTDPFGWLLISVTFCLLILYIFFDIWPRISQERRYQAKMAVVICIVFTTVIALSVFSILLRQVTGPASFSPDGGVIQTEETIKYVLSGKNPYVEDYVDTPMADWGIEFRTALYHYPYLPWTFLFSTPFYLLSQPILGWYDQRFVYLILFVALLFLAPRLARERDQRLCLVMVLGLNPIMGSDVIFGQNDVFVLAWVLFSIYLLQRGHLTWSLVMLGLACTSKPTAWFLIPFYLLYLVRQEGFVQGADLKSLALTLFRKTVPLILVLALLLLPFAVWDFNALFDDVWRWSSGTAEAPYQITGWGLANLVLALGLVQSRLDYFPFWIPELLVCLPLLAVLLWRQWTRNSISSMLYYYAFLALAFLYTSRFMNENYLGYILAVLALAFFTDQWYPAHRTTSPPQ